jgi:hypothetical protein
MDRSGTQSEACEEETVASKRTDSVGFVWPARAWLSDRKSLTSIGQIEPGWTLQDLVKEELACSDVCGWR